MAHAFIRRTWFTCHTCGRNSGGVCEMNRKVIRWDPMAFGRGDYCSGDNEGEPRQMKLEVFR